MWPTGGKGEFFGPLSGDCVLFQYQLYILSHVAYICNTTMMVMTILGIMMMMMSMKAFSQFWANVESAAITKTTSGGSCGWRNTPIPKYGSCCAV